MVPSSFPQIIWEKCEEFVVNFAESNMSILSQKLLHNGKWKETNKELADVISRILASLNNSWNNSDFSSEFAKSQNEGTYVTNVIVSAIQATLKGLPLGRLCQHISYNINRKSNIAKTFRLILIY